ncbi:MAG: 50S ribosomal protein L25 [Planctomycetes bacterium]|nr:50S ribosomal protein L25 [Planctomycetota bacterium]
MIQEVLEARQREPGGSRRARADRRAGLVPAVLYGRGAEVRSLSVERTRLESLLRRHGQVLKVVAGGAEDSAILKDIQYDALGETIVHVDLQRISLDEKVKVSVRLELVGTARGVVAGGVMEQNLHELEVECLPMAIPDSIQVNIKALEVGQWLEVKDLVLPEGVVCLDAADTPVVGVEEPREEEAPAVEAAVEPGAEEPEVIGRKEPKEGEETEE